MIVGVTHFTKGTSGKNPVERVTGSLGFGALPRIVMATARDEDGGRTLVRAASNIGVDGCGFKYELCRKELPEYGIPEAQWIRRGEVIEGSAKEILDAAEGVDDKGRYGTVLPDAMAWLVARLTVGEQIGKEVEKAAVKEGITVQTLRKAREKLNIVVGKQKGVRDGRSLWRLPNQGELELGDF